MIEREWGSYGGIKTCISQRLAEGRGPLVLHIQGVKVYEWVDAEAQRHPEIPVVCVSHTTSDKREYTEGALALKSLVVENMAGSDAKKIHERAMFSQSFVHHVTNLVHDLDLDVRQNRYVVLGYGEIIGRAMWRSLSGQPQCQNNLVVYDPYLDPKVRADAEAHGVVFVDDLDKTLREEKSHFIIECVGKANVFERKHFAALSCPATVVSFGTGSEGFAVKALAEMSQDETGRPLRVARGRVGSLPTYTYEIKTTKEWSIPVTVIAGGAVANFAEGSSNISHESVFNNVMVIDSKRRGIVDYTFDRRGVREHEAIHFDAQEDGSIERRYGSLWDLDLEARQPENHWGKSRFVDRLVAQCHPAFRPGEPYVGEDPFEILKSNLEHMGSSKALRDRVLGDPEAKQALFTDTTPASIPTPVETIDARQLSARSWSEILDVLEAKARTGTLGAVIVDLDNVLFRPRGYVGSEAQE